MVIVRCPLRKTDIDIRRIYGSLRIESLYSALVGKGICFGGMRIYPSLPGKKPCLGYRP